MRGTYYILTSYVGKDTSMKLCTIPIVLLCFASLVSADAPLSTLSDQPVTTAIRTFILDQVAKEASYFENTAQRNTLTLEQPLAIHILPTRAQGGKMYFHCSIQATVDASGKPEDPMVQHLLETIKFHPRTCQGQVCVEPYAEVSGEDILTKTTLTLAYDSTKHTCTIHGKTIMSQEDILASLKQMKEQQTHKD